MTRLLAYLVATLAVAAGIATVSTMSGRQHDLDTVLYLLYVDTALLLTLSALIVAKLVRVWLERRKGRSGAGFHGRLVLMFSLIAVTPAVLVAIFSAVFLNLGMQGWFDDRIRNAIEQSTQVANAYLHEHRQAVRGDILAMANDLNREAPALANNPARFSRVLTTQAAIRNLPEAIVTDRSGNILARTPFSQSLAFDLAPLAAFEDAEDGDVVTMTNEQDDRIRAMVRLSRFVDAYLVVGRFVDPQVVDYISKVERGAAQYRSVEERRGGLQVTFVMLFSVVALLLLLAAAWVGLNLATRYARPIGLLADAAEKVREGDLDVYVERDGGVAEIDTLVDAFNRMAQQLENQKQGLLDANRELDERRRFTETVLAGVSAGVVGLDTEGRLHLPNRSSSKLLGIDLNARIGEALGDVVPEMAPLIGEAMSGPHRQIEREIAAKIGEEDRTLLVRVAAERLGVDEIIGFVVTFDDITDLEAAQRKAAWADVARRIAHEIRNPLTPIQLAAERLKRRYLNEIKSDPDTFLNCTETIVRQVKDIGRMVDEFSSFARMPDPEMRSHDLAAICRDVVFLEDNRDDSISVTFEGPDVPVPVICDREQMSRAIGNLIKNASESVRTRLSKTPSPPGEILIALAEAREGSESHLTVTVTDNGIGLPRENRSRLTEPYVTSREKGTGLGLAIVKKIIEDHAGLLRLEDVTDENSGVLCGARAVLTLKMDTNADRTADADTVRVAGASGAG
ncbi:MAG: PAS domain-containing sensor histidine kinase [Rhodospirillales bacterium]